MSNANFWENTGFVKTYTSVESAGMFFVSPKDKPFPGGRIFSFDPIVDPLFFPF
jgi:hypothetical protein